MSFLAEMDQFLGVISDDIRKDKGSDLRESYVNAEPFPHIVINDFLPEAVLERCLSEFPVKESAADTFDRAQERLKFSFNPDRMPIFSRNLFYSFNSKPFISVIENISGIKGLIPDPYFMGAGFHQISQGGHLSMHADFNHHKPMNLERRINVLIYLNKDWREEYGGQLELWDHDMKHCVQSIVPVFNRCVIFNTTSESMHGNPTPVNHPGGMPRRSIALYYYTATWTGANRDHTTQFRARPNSADKVDWRIKAVEMVADVTPPILMRNLRRIKSGSRTQQSDPTP